MSQKRGGKLQAWVISVDMGYGHQRAAYPLSTIAYERIITANSDKIISEREQRIWRRIRKAYEFLSRMRGKPLVGGLVFGLYDQLQSIGPFFPFRNLSKPNFATLRAKRSIQRGLCGSLVNYTRKQNLPIIATHFFPALAYHYAGLPCYCVVTDTDINRVWVPDRPSASRITYFSPCKHATMRLKEYGVPDERIVETGFPLPLENIGPEQRILKHDLSARLLNLDPHGRFRAKYAQLLKEVLGRERVARSTHPFTITYLVGGSGAGTEIGITILRALHERISKQEVRVIISAGTRLDVKQSFDDAVQRLGLHKLLGTGVQIVFSLDKRSYFASLNQAFRTTDILWTKPSELSFYAALGLPVIIAPPIGAHENFNREWLEHIGSGFVQEDPAFVNDWLFYWVDDGRLAEAALHGFLNAPSDGTSRIMEYLREQEKRP
jgi:hypothetical protein